MDPEPRVVHADEVPEHEARYPPPFDATPLGFGRDLGRAGGAERLGIWRDRLPPGRRSSLLHAHLAEEEAIYVLSGRPTLVWRPPGGPVRRTALRAGSYVAFPAGTGLAHCLENPADAAEDAVLLVIGERRAADRLAYPEQAAFESWRSARVPERCWPEVGGPEAGAGGVPYRIETPHLRLRPFDPPDVWPLVRAIRENHARLSPWFPWAREVPTIDAQLAWVRDRRAAYDADLDYTLGVFHRDGSLVGATGMHLRQGYGTVEFGYWIDQRYEGRGWVSEWVLGLTRVALQALDFERCLIRCEPSNHRSCAIPARLGYTLARTEQEPWPEEEGTRSMQWWVLEREALGSSPAATAAVRAFDAADRRLL